MSKDNYIPSIYNYCDRWCERCKYTDRCFSFQRDVADGIDRMNKDYSDEKVWEHVGKRLSQALVMLQEYAAAHGIDLNNLPDCEEPPPSEKAATLDALTVEMHDEYLDRTKAFFEENKPYFLEKDHETIHWVEMGMAEEEGSLAKWQQVNDQVTVIQWYAYFFGVKMQRAVGGLDEMYEEHWDSPEQSDANRTARIVMLSVERSMAAWQVMLDAFPEKEDDIIKVLALLAKFRRMVETTFPRWAEADPDVVW